MENLSFKSTGEALYRQELISLYSGNMSIRVNDSLIITRRGSALGKLLDQDLITTSLLGEDDASRLASSELPVHRAIYKNTEARAIVHTHPPYAIALSLLNECIIPCDMEGHDMLPFVPVLKGNSDVQAGGLSSEIAAAIKAHKAALVWSHGSFVAAQTLEEAYYLTTILERSCYILSIIESIEAGKEEKEP
jgi:L-fuculose-phosphate aldolase